MARELLRHLGYQIPQRLRSSPLVLTADELRVADTRLPKLILYEMVTEMWKEDTVTEDQSRRKTIKQDGTGCESDL